MASNHTITENLKKYFYSGVGFASHASELLKKTMDESVKAGHVSEREGKRLIDDMLKKIDDQKSGLEDKYNEAVHKFISATSEEIATLQKKVEKLEGQLKAKGTHSGGSAARSMPQPRPAVKTIAKKAVKSVKRAASIKKK